MNDDAKVVNSVDKEVIETPKEEKMPRMLEMRRNRRNHDNEARIFKVNEDEKGKNVAKFRPRSVVKCCIQTNGVDYDLINVPVLRMSTLRMVLSLVVKLQLKPHQMDLSTEVLNAVLNDTIVVKTAPVYEYLILDIKYIQYLKDPY